MKQSSVSQEKISISGSAGYSPSSFCFLCFLCFLGPFGQHRLRVRTCLGHRTIDGPGLPIGVLPSQIPMCSDAHFVVSEGDSWTRLGWLYGRENVVWVLRRGEFTPVFRHCLRVEYPMRFARGFRSLELELHIWSVVPDPVIWLCRLACGDRTSCARTIH